MLLLLGLFFLSSAWGYHPTDEEMERFYGPAHSHRHELMPLPAEIDDPAWRVKAQGTTFRDSTGGRLYVGAISNYGELHNGDTKYAPLLQQQYNLNTAENECKWAATEPSQNTYTWTQCDYASDFAKNATSVFRGHNLCWGSGNPSWILNGGYSQSQLEGYLNDHASQCIHRYNGTTKTAAYCWDVVNEAIDDGSATFKNAPPWYPAIPNYVNLTFQYARTATSTIKLFYNDYGGEGAGTKSDKIYNMVNGMKKGGIPIDGVGLQMHVSTSYYPSPTDLGNNIKRLTALGLEVHITEMDVKCPDTSQLNLQAQVYGSVLQTCLSNPGCKSYQNWGFTDKYTWLGTGQHPLPFDENYNWKPAANTILSTLNAFKGYNVQVWSCNGKSEQKWSIGSDGKMISGSNDWCLDIQLSGSANQTNVWTYPCQPTLDGYTNLLHHIWKLSSEDEIISVHTGKCLEVMAQEKSQMAKAVNVQVMPCTGALNQKWKVRDGAITSLLHAGFCLDAGTWRD